MDDRGPRTYRRFRYDLGKAPLDRDSTVLVEVGADGYPEREVGLNGTGQVGHRYPDERFPDGRYGLFTDYPIGPGDGQALDSVEFEAAWRLVPTLPTPRRVGILTRLFRRLLGSRG